MDIEEAKQRLTIPALWVRLDLPGDCRKNPCQSPFYERVSKASFSVFDDGRAFHDLRTGEGGSAIDFLILATGLSREAACRKFTEMAGGARSPLPVKQSPPAAPQARQKPVFPAFERGTDAELHALAALRHVNYAAPFIAGGAGLLYFATLHGHRAFVLTGDERLNAQARRLDGEPWEHIGGAKAWTLPGSWAAWPLGLGSGRNYPAFMLCEGGPDFLAALHFIHEADAECLCFPLAMLGASQRIHPDALPILAGKRVRIYPHTDKAGREGAERWAAQLATVGATVDCADFTGLCKADGSPVGDLNDCTSIHPDDAKELEGLLPE